MERRHEQCVVQYGQRLVECCNSNDMKQRRQLDCLTMKRMRSAVLRLGLLTLLCFAAYAQSPQPPPAANWISNPSFEEGEDNDPVDWAYSLQHEKTTGLADKAAARTGNRGASVQGGGGLSFGRWMTPYRIALEPNAKYRVSFWYRGKGAEVYLEGSAAELSDSGKLTVDLDKKVKIPVAKPAPATEWTFVEKEVAAPGYPAWVQLCLAGSGRDACAFDDIAIERPGLSLIEPRVPQVVPEGSEISITVSAPELRNAAPDAVTWKAGSAAAIKSAAKNADAGTWTIKFVPPANGDLELEASYAGGKPLKLGVPHFIRVFPVGTQDLFTFAAITDAHFYRKGKNERNEKFARVAGTLNALDPLFVLSLGDQMEIHNSQRDEQKKWIAEAVREQLGLLNMPVFSIAGNHEIDRTYEGPGTRWYHEKYLGRPRYWSFRIGKNLFAGIDVTTPGIATREHGASFLDPAQDAWLESLLSQTQQASVILAGHISPFNDWGNSPDRDRFLSLLLGKKTDLYLCGHTHYTDDAAVPNGQTAPPWPKPEKLDSPATASAALQDPGKTKILTTTTACSFPLGDDKTSGFRYLLVKNGKIAWQDVLPLTLSVQRAALSPDTIKFTVKNGADKPVIGLPLLASLPAGKISATVDGQPASIETQSLGTAVQIVFLQLDVPINTTHEVVFNSKP